MLIQFVKNEERVVRSLFVTDAVRRCDICGKEITGPYFEVMTSHSEWGNDSIESIRLIDCCDSTCLHHAVDRYRNDLETYPSMELQVWHKSRAISNKDLAEIDEDAEQRMELENGEFELIRSLKNR